MSPNELELQQIQRGKELGELLGRLSCPREGVLRGISIPGEFMVAGTPIGQRSNPSQDPRQYFQPLLKYAGRATITKTAKTEDLNWYRLEGAESGFWIPFASKTDWKWDTSDPNKENGPIDKFFLYLPITWPKFSDGSAEVRIYASI